MNRETPPCKCIISNTFMRRATRGNKPDRVMVRGTPDGWIIEAEYDGVVLAVSTRKYKDTVRVFKQFESLVKFLSRAGIHQYMVDASSSGIVAATPPRRPGLVNEELAAQILRNRREEDDVEE